MAIELTKYEWQEVVGRQCSKCKFWTDDEGCLLPDAIDPKPVQDCAWFEEKK